uniref:Putative proline and glutamine-rich splicing factor sfpq n=1 Tax=Hyalomma excavatum TaxID=257692 RepID=A0A131XG56_9ACAR
MSGRRGSSSYPPRHSPYGSGGNRNYGGGGGRQYDERNSHYGQHDGSRSPHQQSQHHPSQQDNRYPSKSMPPPQQQPRSSSQPSKPSPQPPQQQQQSPRATPPPQQPAQQTPRPPQAQTPVNNTQQQKTPVQQQKPSPVQQQKKEQPPNLPATTPPKPVAKVETPSPVPNQNSQPATNTSSGQNTPNAAANSTNVQNASNKPVGEHAENCKLFVSNVSNMMNDESFRKMFEEHGEVRDIFLNKTKWFGFVLFKTHEQAEKALRALNGTEKNGRRLNVRYATQQKPDQGGPPAGVPSPQQMQQQQQQQQGPFGGPPGQGPPMPPPYPQPVKRSGARCRLFVGNLGNTMTEEEFRRMFGEYGELLEVFLHAQKGFGFVKYEQRHQAEAAKAALDNTPHEGRYLQVRFATQGSSLKVKNLSPFVSNELLEDAFSIFGEIDRAVVIVDDRGRSVGEGIVEFARKTSALAALKKASQSCLLLTASPRPVLVEPLDLRDEEDGFPEKNINKNNPQYLKEREIGPRFAEPGTFEYEFSSRWKKLLELEKQKREFLEREMEDERRKLEEEMEYYRYEHETRLLREQLRIMEEQSKIFQHEREMRHAEQKRREEMRRQEEMLLRQREEDILGFTRREQAAQQAASMQQQMAAATQQHDPLATAAAQAKAPASAIEGATFVSSYDSGTRVSRFDQQQPPQQHYGMQADDGRRPEDYADRDPKRRRY